MRMKSLPKITFQKISRYHCTGTGVVTPDSCCLHSFFLIPVMRIKRTMLKIAVIENKFPLQINEEISVWLKTALGLKSCHLWQ